MKALWLLAAYSSCVLGFACVALSMESHWRQVRGESERPGRMTIMLRALGTLGVLASLLLCLQADRASMAALVWVLTLTAAALTVAFTLAWRPLWLMPLAAWVRSGDIHGGAP